MLRSIIALLIGCLLFVAIPGGAAAESRTGMVEGTVTHDGRPVEGAVVDADGQRVRTDAEGQFRLAPVEVVGIERLITIVVRAPGLGMWRLSDARVIPDDTLRITTKLEARNVELRQPKPRAKAFSTTTTPQMEPSSSSPTTVTATSTSAAPPSTIRVYVTGSADCNPNAAGTVQVVNFKYYVKHVLPNEWLSGWPTESLRAGAMATKHYGWYQVNRGGKWPGLGADVMDSQCDQVYNPAVSYASMDKAIDDTWDYKATRDGSVHVSYYRAGSQGDGTDYGNDIMYQWGTEYWARQGKSWSWMLQYYYDNLVISSAASTITINGGETYSKSSTVRVTSSAPAGTTHVRLSSSSATSSGLLSKGMTYAYTSAINWNLANTTYGGSTTNGVRAVYAQWRDSAGRWSTVRSDTIVLDTRRPVMSKVAHGFVIGTVLSASGVPVRLTWSATDATSGVARYQVQRSVDGAGYTWAVSGTTAKFRTEQAVIGRAYRFRVRAQDHAGNWTAWAYSLSFVPSRYQENTSAVAYPVGTWAREAWGQASGGYVAHAAAAGATARFQFTGSRVSWAATRAPNRGQADVLVDGVFVRTVDLYASTAQPRSVVFARSWVQSGTHTITIKVRGTAGRPTVIVDAFGVFR